jgi:hypothetical protein
MMKGQNVVVKDENGGDVLPKFSVAFRKAK